MLYQAFIISGNTMYLHVISLVIIMIIIPRVLLFDCPCVDSTAQVCVDSIVNNV